MGTVFLGMLGLCAGLTVSSGVAGLILGLSILPRYAGITRTARHILLYEDCTILGVILGNACLVFGWRIPVGAAGLAVYGLFAGIFMGSWILALAEMAKVFPVLAARVRLKQGMPWIIVSVAAGKLLGALYAFYRL